MLEDRNAPNGFGNSSPFAADDWFDLLHDTTLFANLLWNDCDPDGDTLSITRINGQTYTPGTQIALQEGDLVYGYLTVEQDSSFTFTPSLRYKGPVTFSYTISDGEYESTAWVTINVFNNEPVLSDQWFSILHDQDLMGNLLSGAYDPDGDIVRITHINGQAVTYGEAISLPSGASLTIFADGTSRYTPPSNFVGSDSFSLTISDDLDSYTAMVNIQVTNNAPYAYDASFSILHDRELTGQLYGYDPDGDTITAQLVSGPTNGTLTLHADGSFTYTPNTNFVGADSFTYTWSDGLTTGNIATVSIDVYNNAPYAYDASFTVLHDRELTGQLYGYDPDGDTITAQLVSGPTNGTLTLHADGSFTYTPNTHYVGPDSFTYTWSDGLGNGGVATVEIGVYNSAPAAQGESFKLEPGESFAVFLGGSIPSDYHGRAVTVSHLLANDWDPDGDPLEVVRTGNLSEWWRFDSDWNAWVFSASSEFTGVDDSFEYFVTDQIPVNRPYSETYNEDETYPYSSSWRVCMLLQVGGGASGGGGGSLPNLEVREVEFRNGVALWDDQRFVPDPTSASGKKWEPRPYSAPHWIREGQGGATYNPYAFIAGEDVKVVAKFQLSAAFGTATTIYVYGDGPGNIDFGSRATPKEITVGAQATWITAQFTAANTFSEVRHIPQFDIHWYWSPNRVDWYSAGQSSGYVYVLAKAPAGVRPYHTLVWLSCTAADGKAATDRDGIIEAVHDRFRQLDVSTYWGGNKLTYWKDWAGVPVIPSGVPGTGIWPALIYYSTQGILAYHDGRCEGWSRFLFDTLRVQGITGGRGVFIHANKPDGTRVPILVIWWREGIAKLDRAGLSRFVNIADSPFGLVPGRDSYNWDYSEVVNQPGIAGQNNPNPQSIFEDGHMVLEITLRGKTVWLDPSYGKMYEGDTDVDRWENFMSRLVDYVIYNFWTPLDLIDERALELDLNRNGILDAAPYNPTKFIHVLRRRTTVALIPGITRMDLPESR